MRFFSPKPIVQVDGARPEANFGFPAALRSSAPPTSLGRHREEPLEARLPNESDAIVRSCAECLLSPDLRPPREACTDDRTTR